jgi:hypothetical protein
VQAVWPTGAAGKVKMGGSSRTEEQQQSKKHSSVKQQQRTVWTAAGKASSAEGVASKRQSSTEQPVTRPTRDPSVETPDRRGKHQQQPITCQVGSAVSNMGAFLLLSQVS